MDDQVAIRADGSVVIHAEAIFSPELARTVRKALLGDSNDAEHDALYEVAEHFGLDLSRDVDVEWETDGDEPELPTRVRVPGDVYDEDVAGWLSDEYDWLVVGWSEVEPATDGLKS